MSSILLIQEAFRMLPPHFRGEAELVLQSTGFAELVKQTIVNCNAALVELDDEDPEQLQAAYAKIRKERDMYSDLLELCEYCQLKHPRDTGVEQ